MGIDTKGGQGADTLVILEGRRPESHQQFVAGLLPAPALFLLQRRGNGILQGKGKALETGDVQIAGPDPSSF